MSKSESRLWEQLNQHYMTEESDDDSNCGVIVEHRLPWRSQCKMSFLFSYYVKLMLHCTYTAIILFIALNEFIQELDRRYDEKVKKEGGTMPRKTRQSGPPSKSPPPLNAPAWTVNTQTNHDLPIPAGAFLESCDDNC